MKFQSNQEETGRGKALSRSWEALLFFTRDTSLEESNSKFDQTVQEFFFIVLEGLRFISGPVARISDIQDFLFKKFTIFIF